MLCHIDGKPSEETVVENTGEGLGCEKQYLPVPEMGPSQIASSIVSLSVSSLKLIDKE